MKTRIAIFIAVLLAAKAYYAYSMPTVKTKSETFTVTQGVFPSDTILIHTIFIKQNRPPNLIEIINACPEESSGAVYFRFTHFVLESVVEGEDVLEFGFHCVRNQLQGY